MKETGRDLRLNQPKNSMTKIKRRSTVARKKKKSGAWRKLVVCVAFAMCFVTSMCIYIPAGNQNDQREQFKASEIVHTTPPFDLDVVLEDLQSQVHTMSKQPKLYLGAFAVEPSTGRYVSVRGEESFAAASMIKVPVLVKLLLAMDNKEVSIDEVLDLRPDLIGGGSGFLQWRKPWSKVTLKEAMETMIIFSDNTSTNLIIDRLGGIDVCNKEFERWGLKQTTIHNWLPDLEGTNRTSPHDLVSILARVDKGDVLSAEGRERMLAIMEKTRIKTLLPFGLPPGAKIAHKTGDIGSLVGDCGIIDSPDGRRFIACVQVARPHNDRRANELIRQVSKVLYSGIVSDNNSRMISTRQRRPL